MAGRRRPDGRRGRMSAARRQPPGRVIRCEPENPYTSVGVAGNEYEEPSVQWVMRAAEVARHGRGERAWARRCGRVCRSGGAFANGAAGGWPAPALRPRGQRLRRRRARSAPPRPPSAPAGASSGGAGPFGRELARRGRSAGRADPHFRRLATAGSRREGRCSAPSAREGSPALGARAPAPSRARALRAPSRARAPS
jgi:hypothetical protein